MRYGAHWTVRGGLSIEANALVEVLDAKVTPVMDADSFFSGLLEAVKSVQSLIRGGSLEDEVVLATAKRYLATAEQRIALSDLISDHVERARRIAETALPTTMTRPEDYRDWLERLAAGSRLLARLCALVGFWGQPEHLSLLIRGLDRLSRWPIEGGISVAIAARRYPALIAAYAAGISSIASGNHEIIAGLLRAKLPHGEPRRPGDDELIPMPRVLNAISVLDYNAVQGILNIGAERTMRYHTPNSLYLEGVVRPLLKDLIPDEAAFQGYFDTFEAVLSLRYVADGGRGLPVGQYGYRGERSFVGRGIPEQLQTELTREGVNWWPVKSGVFDSLEEATAAMTELLTRLTQFQF